LRRKERCHELLLLVTKEKLPAHLRLVRNILKHIFIMKAFSNFKNLQFFNLLPLPLIFLYEG
jgi:hypothetical protein